MSPGDDKKRQQKEPQPSSSQLALIFMEILINQPKNPKKSLARVFWEFCINQSPLPQLVSLIRLCYVH